MSSAKERSLLKICKKKRSFSTFSKAAFFENLEPEIIGGIITLTDSSGTILKIYPNHKMSKYQGALKDGCKHGHGVEVLFEQIDKCKKRTKYVGNWNKGEKDGEGIQTVFYENHYKSKYDGAWKNGVKSGFGTDKCVNISINGNGYQHEYVGDWKDGLPNGVGFIEATKTCENRILKKEYSGAWRNGKVHGSGTGETYVRIKKNSGNWEDGLFIQ